MNFKPAEWLSITFKEEDIEEAKHQDFEDFFRKCKQTAEDVEGFALFFRRHPDGIGRTYFFSIIHLDYCFDIIRKFPLLENSGKPSKLPLTVAVGDKSDYEFWFND